MFAPRQRRRDDNGYVVNACPGVGSVKLWAVTGRSSAQSLRELMLLMGDG